MSEHETMPGMKLLNWHIKSIKEKPSTKSTNKKVAFVSRWLQISNNSWLCHA